MGKNGNSLDNLIHKLDRIENHMAEEIAKDVDKLFRNSVYDALLTYYRGYYPKQYRRTLNFLDGVYESAKAFGRKNTLIMSVSSGHMDAYPGWFKQSLEPSVAFDMFFDNGEHGHGKFLKAVSNPTPYQLVDRAIESKFNGQIDKIMRITMNRILG